MAGVGSYDEYTINYYKKNLNKKTNIKNKEVCYLYLDGDNLHLSFTSPYNKKSIKFKTSIIKNNLSLFVFKDNFYFIEQSELYKMITYLISNKIIFKFYYNIFSESTEISKEKSEVRKPEHGSILDFYNKNLNVKFENINILFSERNKELISKKEIITYLKTEHEFKKYMQDIIFKQEMGFIDYQKYDFLKEFLVSFKNNEPMFCGNIYSKPTFKNNIISIQYENENEIFFIDKLTNIKIKDFPVEIKSNVDDVSYCFCFSFIKLYNSEKGQESIIFSCFKDDFMLDDLTNFYYNTNPKIINI